MLLEVNNLSLTKKEFLHGRGRAVARTSENVERCFWKGNTVRSAANAHAFFAFTAVCGSRSGKFFRWYRALRPVCINLIAVALWKAHWPSLETRIYWFSVSWFSSCDQRTNGATHVFLEDGFKGEHPKCDRVLAPPGFFWSKLFSVILRLRWLGIHLSSSLCWKNHQSQEILRRSYENGSEKVDGKTRQSLRLVLEARKLRSPENDYSHANIYCCIEADR